MDDGGKDLTVAGVPALTGIENFFVWREAIEPLLIGIRAFDIVRGHEPRPSLPPMPTSTDIRLSESWKDRDAKAMSFIRRTVSGALKAMLRDLSSSSGMWSLLAELHDLGTPEHRGAINRKFHGLFLDEGGDMVAHLNTFMELVAEAASAGLSWGTNDKDKCDRFLDTLPHSLRVVRTEWRQLPKEEQTFLSLVRVYNEEKASLQHTADRTANAMAMAASQQHFAIKGTAARALGGKATSSHGKTKTFSSPSSTRATSGSSGKPKPRGGGKQGSSKRLLCYGCGSRDHTRPDCPVASHLGPGGGPICWNCHKQGHVRTECTKPSSGKAAAALEAYPDADSMLGAMVELDHLATSASSTLVAFMVDSGASQHIVDRADLLASTRKADKTLSFKTVGAKQTSDIIGDVTGTLASGRAITFRDVVLLPGAGVNLLSEELLRERGWVKVIDDDDNAHLEHKDNSSWRMPLTKRGRARWLLLRVELSAPPSAASGVLAPVQSPASSPLLQLHQRLGHIGFSTIKKLIRSGHLPSVPGATDEKPWCDSCEATKATRGPFSDAPLRGAKPLELVHSDVAGPLVACYGGYRYYVVFIDDYTDWTTVALLRSKAEVFHRFVEWVKLAERAFDAKVQVLRTDGGGEYVNKHLSTWTASRGILHHITPPHTPELNGKAERKNRTLKEMAAAMLHGSGLAAVWWGHAIIFAAVLLMKLTTVEDGRTVWEWVHKRKPSLGKAQAFGSPCWVHVPSADRGKSDLTVPKAWKGRMVSWPSERSGWGVYSDTTGKIVFSRNVSFGPKLGAQVRQVDDPVSDVVQLDLEADDYGAIDSGDDGGDADDSASDDEEPGDLPRGRKRLAPEEMRPHGDVNDNVVGADRPKGIRRLPARANRGQRSARFWDQYGTLLQESEGLLCSVTLIDNDPKSYGEAMASPQRHEWSKAFDSELQSLIRNETLEEVVLPPGAKVVSTKWVCKTKRDADGNFVKYKARLVGRGFTQRYGIDYDETYAPVGRMTSMRIFFVMAAVKNLVVWQMDAETAFLNPEMDRLLYISFPEGWAKQDPKATGLVVRKGLYGFKQSARLWWLDVVSKLQVLGFTHSDADWGIFVRVESDGSRTIVFVYVDDFLIAAKSQAVVNTVREGLKAAYKMSDIGPVSSVLGIKVDKVDRGFALSQGHYIDTVLERFDMSDCRPEPTPIAVGTKLVAEGVKLGPDDARQYQALIGCLMWIALSTRPDISFAVSALSRFNGSPTEMHFKVAKRVLRYLSATRDLVLLLVPSKNGDAPQLDFSSDADWAGNIDDRNSQSGYVGKLHGAVVTWGSLRQQCVSLSSVESEYVALAEAAKDAIWLRTAILAYEQTSPDTVDIVLKGDNQGALALAQNPGWHRRTKHIDIRYHFIRWQVEDGAIKLKYVGTSDQVADIFTKATPTPTLVKHRAALGLVKLSSLDD